MILGSPGKVGRCQIYAHHSRKALVGFFFGLGLAIVVRLLVLTAGASWDFQSNLNIWKRENELHAHHRSKGVGGFFYGTPIIATVSLKETRYVERGFLHLNSLSDVDRSW